MSATATRGALASWAPTRTTQACHQIWTLNLENPRALKIPRVASSADLCSVGTVFQGAVKRSGRRRALGNHGGTERRVLRGLTLLAVGHRGHLDLGEVHLLQFPLTRVCDAVAR